MKKLILLSLVFAQLVGNEGLAQTDAKAKAILDEVSKKTKSYTSIAADFSYKIDNKTEKTSDTQEGKLLVKGDKYKLDIANQTVISDNKTVWTVLKESKEIQVNAVNNKEEGINPSTIFTVYEKGFKYEFVKEEPQKDGSTWQVIKLYPVDTKKKSFHTVTLFIDKAKKQITSLKVNGKDGTDATYTIKKFTPNTDVTDATFAFNPKSLPGYEVIDLRE